MSAYQHKADFISRTRKILNEFETNTDYEKTFFLNCCLGLLIIPQQYAIGDKNMYVIDIVSYDEWGIDITKIKNNTTAKHMSKNSAENIARHIRNSISHCKFDIIKPNVNIEKIRTITIEDINPHNKKQTFYLELSFDDFRKFVLKYSQEQEKILRQKP